MIQNEKDSYLKTQIISSISNCPYDPNQTIINSLDILLKTTNSKKSSLLISICDATYEICRFMGRPVLYSHGMNMLTQLLYPQYDLSVQEHARETLKKISQLKI